VIFFEEPLIDDIDAPVLRELLMDGGTRVVTPVVPASITASECVVAQRSMLDALLKRHVSSRTIFWYYTPMALLFSDHLAPEVCVYDNMDELSAFRGASSELMQLENVLIDRASIMFTGGYSLYEAKKHRHHNIHGVPSSIDRSHFKKPGILAPDPADQRSISFPRVGFFGVIDERMDISLLQDLASLRPSWQFVMIGPVVKVDPGSLPQAANIHWLGQKAYADLPAYLHHWDVGFMPFALNEATRYISPTKTPEFLAASLPVVSTPIFDVVHPYGDAGLVEIASSPRDMVASIERLLEGVPAGWQSRVDLHIAENSWDQTWQGMSDLIEEVPGAFHRTVMGGRR
jgi:hypothetical protein